MESGNGIHLEDENGVMNVRKEGENVETNVVDHENSNEVEEGLESSRLGVSESSENVNVTEMANSIDVTTNGGTSKNNKLAKIGPNGSVLARKLKPHLTQSVSFPAKPQNHDSMRTSMDGHPVKPRAALSNGNAMHPANRRASIGVKAKEMSAGNGVTSTRRATLDSVPSVHASRPRKANGSAVGPPSEDPLI